MQIITNASLGIKGPKLVALLTNVIILQCSNPRLKLVINRYMTIIELENSIRYVVVLGTVTFWGTVSKYHYVF